MSFNTKWIPVIGMFILLVAFVGYSHYLAISEANAQISTLTEQQKQTSERLLKSELTVEEKDAAVQTLTHDLTGLKAEHKETQASLEKSRADRLSKEDQLKKLKDKVKKAEADAAKARQEAETAKKQAAAKAAKKKALAAAEAKEKAAAKKKTVATASKTPSRSAEPSSGKSFYVQSTAYTASCAGCSGITRTGIDLRANPGLKVIAVDPNVIPLGSKVHVEGYGTAIAGDTGGAIKGNKIDVFLATQSQAVAWGRKSVKITVLR